MYDVATAAAPSMVRVNCRECSATGVYVCQNVGEGTQARPCDMCLGSGAQDFEPRRCRKADISYTGRKERRFVKQVVVDGRLGIRSVKWTLTYEQFLEQVPAADVIEEETL